MSCLEEGSTICNIGTGLVCRLSGGVVDRIANAVSDVNTDLTIEIAPNELHMRYVAPYMQN